MSRRNTPKSLRSTPVSTPGSRRGSGSGFPPIQKTQQRIAIASKGLPQGLLSKVLPASVGVVQTNPRYETSSKATFKAPSANLGVGGAINSKYKPVSRGFSYSFPGMFQDTGIGSLEKEADRREMHIKAAKERLERLERLKIEHEEKRRIRDAIRAKKRADKAMFNYAITSLQSAFRGHRDREVVSQALHERRQMMRVVHAIQSAIRGHKGRAVAHERKKVIVGAATKIQRRYSARLGYKQAQKDIEKMLRNREVQRQQALEQFQDECATTLQAFFRGSRERAMVAARKKKRSKRLKALQSKEAAMKAKLAAMAGGKKKKKKTGSPKARRRSGSAKKKKR